MIRFQKKHILTLFFSLLILALLGATFYYFSVMKMDERISTLQQQLISIQNQNNTPQEEVPDNLNEDLPALVERVPVESLEEQIILDLEKAALGAESVILSIGFNENAVEAEAETETNVEDIETAEEYIEEMTPEERATYEAGSITLPQGLNQIQIAISVRSKDYESMTTFLENVRQLPRIYVVESFSFTGFEETEVRPGPNEDELDYTVQLVSYYAPIIQTVADSSGIVLPEPAGKENPLHDVKEEEEDSMGGWVEDDPLSETTLQDFLDLIEQSRKEDSSDSEDVVTPEDEVADEKPEETEQSRQYTVQRGDTLFSISMRFYGSREGESLIKEANHKKSDIVIIGETLIIP
ncbi:LysM peptidoglycan-binding domain-containing protein [Chungangia koreensis]|uniref:LysM peptidoglycan-binding domain-containing protein n=1 Tax=Chungangia koreensis TaxID=752657 RepID=A0ABV8X3D7_9LACT